MKHRSLIPSVLIIIVGIVLSTLVGCNGRPIPQRDLPAVYRHYQHTQGLKGTYIEDYKVNDSISLAATVIEATETAAWNRLLIDFNIDPRKESTAPTDSIRSINATMWISKDNFQCTHDPDPAENDLAVFYFEENTFIIYHIKMVEQVLPILYHGMNKHLNIINTQPNEENL